MTRDQAETLLREQLGDVCVQLYRRADGTVLTSDCPDGVARKRRRLRIVSTVAVSLAAAASATLAAWHSVDRSAVEAPGDGLDAADFKKGRDYWNSLYDTTPRRLADLGGSIGGSPQVSSSPAHPFPPRAAPEYPAKMVARRQELMRKLDQQLSLRASMTDPDARRGIEYQIRETQLDLRDLYFHPQSALLRNRL